VQRTILGLYSQKSGGERTADVNLNDLEGGKRALSKSPKGKLVLNLGNAQKNNVIL
jgi:hypothetical protein